jgi:hypothetical protein
VLGQTFAYAYNAANQRTAVTNADGSRWSLWEVVSLSTSGPLAPVEIAGHYRASGLTPPRPSPLE